MNSVNMNDFQKNYVLSARLSIKESKNVPRRISLIGWTCDFYMDMYKVRWDAHCDSGWIWRWSVGSESKIMRIIWQLFIKIIHRYLNNPRSNIPLKYFQTHKFRLVQIRLALVSFCLTQHFASSKSNEEEKQHTKRKKNPQAKPNSRNSLGSFISCWVVGSFRRVSSSWSEFHCTPVRSEEWIEEKKKYVES